MHVGAVQEGQRVLLVGEPPSVHPHVEGAQRVCCSVMRCARLQGDAAAAACARCMHEQGVGLCTRPARQLRPAGAAVRAALCGCCIVLHAHPCRCRRCVCCARLQIDDLIATGGTLCAGINLMSESLNASGVCGESLGRVMGA